MGELARFFYVFFASFYIFISLCMQTHQQPGHLGLWWHLEKCSKFPSVAWLIVIP